MSCTSLFRNLTIGVPGGTICEVGPTGPLHTQMVGGQPGRGTPWSSGEPRDGGVELLVPLIRGNFDRARNPRRPALVLPDDADTPARAESTGPSVQRLMRARSPSLGGGGAGEVARLLDHRLLGAHERGEHCLANQAPGLILVDLHVAEGVDRDILPAAFISLDDVGE